MAGPLEALMGYEPPAQQPGALNQLMQQPPANPLTPMAGRLSDLFGLTDAYNALRGRMTEGEAQDFAVGAAFGLVPGARALRPAAKLADPPAVLQDALTSLARGEISSKQVKKIFQKEGWQVDLRRGRYEYEAFDPDGKEHFIAP
jgi:hypothetical protein